MGKLLKYLKGYQLESVLGPLFKLLEASFELLVPLVVARMIDVGIRNRDLSEITKLGAVLVLLAVIGMVCSITAQYFAAKAAAGFGTGLRHDLYAHINGLSYTELDTIGMATLITRMTSDINQVQSGVNLFLRLFLRSPFIVLGAMGMAFTIDVKAALVFVVAIPMLSVVVFGIMFISMPLYKKVQRRLDRVLLAVKENLEGARVIRAFNRQEDEIRAFDEENGLLVKVQVFVGKISALLNPLTYVILNLAIVVLIWVGGRKVDAGIITQGQTVALVNYMSQILVELVKVANLIITISKALACANRVSSVLEIRSSMEDIAQAVNEDIVVAARGAGSKSVLGGEIETVCKGVAAGEKVAVGEKVAAEDEVAVGEKVAAGEEVAAEEKVAVGEEIGVGEKGPAGKSVSPCEIAVEFQDIEFTYAGAKEPALSGISFQARRGQTVGIIGGTGSGKTTLVNLIPRFYDVEAGRVLVNGKDVREYPFSELMDEVGVVPQHAVLFQGTLRENMWWGKKDAGDEEICQALEIAQAAPFVEDKGQGLDLWISQGGGNLSGGQKQRLTIARALVRRPEILIMDDSASALDFATDASLRRAIREHTGDMTVFLVSQRASTVKQSDLILVLDDGRLAGAGTHSQLLETCDVYREICLSQLSKEEVQ